MIAGVLQDIMFVAAFFFPFTLLLLGYLIYLAVYCVKNWNKKSVRIGVGVLSVCMLVLFCVLEIETMPYSTSSARRLYQHHQAAYDAIVDYMMEQAEVDGTGTFHWSSGWNEWPEEIRLELNEVLGNWTLRCGSPSVSVSTRVYRGNIEVEVHFEIYSYSRRNVDSGDGYVGTEYRYQELVYLPPTANASRTRDLTHLTGNWYLYTSTYW